MMTWTTVPADRLTITNTPSGAGYSSSNSFSVVVTVRDDDPAPTLEIRGGEAAEGNAGTTPLTFTVTKSGATDQVVTVAYADAGTAGTGTATAGTDYTAVAGSLTFEPAETSKTITVMVQGDDLSEPDETVVIALRSPSNATIAEGKGTATGTIVDDDASRLSIEAGAARVDEGETLIFTVTLDPPIDDQQVTVEVDAGGTATAGTDYKGVPEMLTFVAGDAAKTITVAVEDDTDYELNETVVIALRNPRPPGDVVIDEAGEAMVTIVDNDDPPDAVHQWYERCRGERWHNEQADVQGDQKRGNQHGGDGGLRGCRHGHGDRRHRLHRGHRGYSDIRAERNVEDRHRRGEGRRRVPRVTRRW